jgi:hypothetical protein
MKPPSNAANVLLFLFERLKNMHGENPNFDYMLKLKEIGEWFQKYDEAELPKLDRWTQKMWSERDQRVYTVEGSKEAIEHLSERLKLLEELYAQRHLGPTDPTSPSSKPTTSESPTSTAGGSSKPPEATLLDQLKAVMNSYGLSHLNVTRASELWSFGFSQTQEPAQSLDLVKHAAEEWARENLR